MKQTFLSVSFILFTILSYAQLEKNTWLVGGSGSFYSYKETYTNSAFTNNNKASEIKINASIGYFPIDKLAAGVRPSFSYYKGKEYVNGTLTNPFSSPTQFLIGPFAKYYFLQKDKQFNILTDISYLFGINSQPLPPNDKGSINELNINGGIEVFFNSSIGMEFLVGYKSKYEDTKGITGYSDKKNGFNVSIGFQIHLTK